MSSLPAWKRRRYERLGIAIPEEARKQSQPAAEHAASALALRELERMERDHDDFANGFTMYDPDV